MGVVYMVRRVLVVTQFQQNGWEFVEDVGGVKFFALDSVECAVVEGFETRVAVWSDSFRVLGLFVNGVFSASLVLAGEDESLVVSFDCESFSEGFFTLLPTILTHEAGFFGGNPLRA